MDIDFVKWIESAWDKGAWCVVAVVLWISIGRFVDWLKPWLETFFRSQISLIDKINETCERNAAANETHARANEQTALAVERITRLLRHLSRTLDSKRSTISRDEDDT